jgi:hypothetical protein
MHDNAPAYGLWSLVLINSAVFIIFAASFTRTPKSPPRLAFSRSFLRLRHCAVH